jgi:rhodanese-related sulfurtransferase
MRKRCIVLALMLVVFIAGTGTGALADNNTLKMREAKVLEEFLNEIPEEKRLNLEQFYMVYQEVMSGTKDAYLLDVRTHEEFYAFHIEGTDHISSGLMYTIPKKIKDPDAAIYIFCRTGHRAKYVAGFLYKYGYTNVYMYDGGVVAWAKAGYPLVNQFTGQFKIIDYQKTPSERETSFRTRDFHPY